MKMKCYFDQILTQYKKERNEALFSLNETKIKLFAAKWKIRMPSSFQGFWGGIYKALLLIPECPPDIQEKAKTGLKELGMSEGIGEWSGACQEDN